MLVLYNQNNLSLYQIVVFEENNNTYVSIAEPYLLSTNIEQEIATLIQESLKQNNQTFNVNSEEFKGESCFQELNIKEEPYKSIPFKRADTEDVTPFTQDDIENVSKKIFDKFHNGELQDWVTVRDDVLTINNMKIVEARSDETNYLNGKATQIAISLIDNNKTIKVTYLNPDFLDKVNENNSSSLVANAIETIITKSFKDIGIDVRDDNTPPSIPNALQNQNQ